VIYYPSKVVAIADAFSALISKRPFRAAYSVAEAIQIIKSEKGKFDPQLVDVLVNVFGKSAGEKAA
jgi:putative two-component system response regulator